MILIAMHKEWIKGWLIEEPILSNFTSWGYNGNNGQLQMSTPCRKCLNGQSHTIWISSIPVVDFSPTIQLNKSTKCCQFIRKIGHLTMWPPSKIMTFLPNSSTISISTTMILMPCRSEKLFHLDHLRSISVREPAMPGWSRVNIQNLAKPCLSLIHTLKRICHRIGTSSGRTIIMRDTRLDLQECHHQAYQHLTVRMIILLWLAPFCRPILKTVSSRKLKGTNTWLTVNGNSYGLEAS